MGQPISPSGERAVPKESRLLNVVCVKWGAWCSPHGSRYVNNLYRGIAQNLSRNHRFICFTDDSTGLDPAIEVRALPGNLQGWWWDQLYAGQHRQLLRPLLALPYALMRSRDTGRGLDDERMKSRSPIDLRGWYNKLFLFKPGVLEGPTVFVDLDTVVLGPLDEIFNSDADLCILRDFYRPRDYGSGLMAFRPEAMAEVWNDFVRQGCPIMRRGDQAFIQRIVPGAEFFQDRLPGQVVSYKLNCEQQGVPDYARMICFHGLPRPHEVLNPTIVRAFDRVTADAPLRVAATV